MANHRQLRLYQVLALFTGLAGGGLFIAADLAWAAPAPPAQMAAAEVRGLVVDTSGAPVPGARVVVQGGTRPFETETGPNGRFEIAEPLSGDAVLSVTAPGFDETTSRVSVGELTIVLRPAPLFDAVTVTASRGVDRLEGPAATTVLTSADLLNSAAGSIDDALRFTPGFSLFRRASSRVANPTTQGVTLRGVSGSGASRTLVLADGLPLNDPFGSWVYWNKIPQAAIERVEVVRGATGDLYGADALGGVIQVLTASPGRARFRGTFEGGSHSTVRGSFFGGGESRGWTGSVAGEWLETDGVFVVAENERGPVDIKAGSDYKTVYGALGYVGNGWRARGRASYYEEDRANGARFQVNDTEWRQFSGEAAGTTPNGTWQARVAGGTQDYFQTFSTILPNSFVRTSDRLNRTQTVPTEFASYGGQWASGWGPHVVLVGGEGKWIDAPFSETAFSAAGVASGPFLFGGKEVDGSVYGRTSLAASDDVTVVLGARGDFWKSTPVNPNLPTHSVSFFSPRASVAWRVDPAVTVAASAYRAYRTPTLNELHRVFSAGATLTSANPELQPERLTGMDGGVLFARGRTSTRVTAFYNHLDDAIANVTVSTTPTLTTRQRQNAGRIRAAGLEFETDIRVTPTVMVTGLAVFTASKFRDAPKLPDLEGNRVPEVPGYQFGAGVTYSDPDRLTATAQLRVMGDQWEDDLNTLELGKFGVVDVYAGRSVYRGLHAFIAIENLFDEEYAVGRTPVRVIGWPRTVRVGARVFLP